jgi:hypothetical protein
MSSIFKSSNNNYYSNRTYSNMFVDPKVEKERQLKQKELIEKEQNELAIKNAFDKNNFTESLVKSESLVKNNKSEVKPLSFLEKAKLGAEKQEPVKKQVSIKNLEPVIDTPQKQVDPFFKAVIEALVDLHEREEIKERNRIGDDRYDEKYGKNDENYMDYFDMLDEQASFEEESDSDSDSE